MKVDKAASGINVRSRGNRVSFKYENGTSQNLLDLILFTQTTYMTVGPEGSPTLFDAGLAHLQILPYDRATTRLKSHTLSSCRTLHSAQKYTSQRKRGPAPGGREDAGACAGRPFERYPMEPEGREKISSESFGP